MSAVDVPEQRTQAIRLPRASVTWSLIAAALFLTSAALQLAASLQRWVVFRGAFPGNKLSVEDHLYDYTYPAEPWESIGTAAQLFGAGILIAAGGVLAMTIAVVSMPRKGSHRGIRILLEFVIAAVIASWLVMYGLRALLSGLAGSPVALQPSGWLGLGAFVGVIALGVLWLFRAPAAALACMFLIDTVSGQLFSTLLMAPLVAGYTSHDTTPWTETVGALGTGAAGISMILAAVWAHRVVTD
ncbi:MULTISPECIES: hypothetical protein [unclassified Cryobacterium]|uniref:hypothetical protein n=1 Tax=unclassified Cryobacterium TaxID=2649013 RepID=UPI00144552D6|nr:MULTISPECIES: hypothetical protein [unclassified Cryobacterium]